MKILFTLILLSFSTPALASCDWYDLEALIQTDEPSRFGSCPDITQIRNSSGETLLFPAIRFGALKSASWLLQQGADANAESRDQCTALCHAQDLSAARLLVEAGAKIKRQELWYASAHYRGDVMEYLANLASEEAVRGQGDFFQYLSFYDDQDLRSATLLVKKGADLNQALPDGVKRRSPLSSYIEHYVENNSEYVTHGLKAIRFLVENGADVNAYFAKKGNPILYYALDSRRTDANVALEILHLFASHGFFFEQLDRDGQTLLMQMASAQTNTENREGYVQTILAEILRLGANPNTQGFEGRTALHWAIRWCNDVTALMLVPVTNTSLRDQKGRTPEDYVREQLDLYSTAPEKVEALEKILRALKGRM